LQSNTHANLHIPCPTLPNSPACARKNIFASHAADSSSTGVFMLPISQLTFIRQPPKNGQNQTPFCLTLFRRQKIRLCGHCRFFAECSNCSIQNEHAQCPRTREARCCASLCCSVGFSSAPAARLLKKRKQQLRQMNCPWSNGRSDAIGSSARATPLAPNRFLNPFTRVPL
jgi:hypothetical protein